MGKLGLGAMPTNAIVLSHMSDAVCVRYLSSNPTADSIFSFEFQLLSQSMGLFPLDCAPQSICLANHPRTTPLTQII